MSGARPGAGRGVLAGAAAALLWGTALWLLALRFLAPEADPLPIRGSGDLLTDEGWYAKAALLKVRFGVWTTPGDFVPLTHNALHSLWLWLAFTVGGVSITTARLACTSLYATGALGMAAAFGRRTGAWPAAGLLLGLVAGHFLALVYSRLALPDISADGLDMLAMAAWGLAPHRGLRALHMVALALAGAALLCKASHGVVWGVLVLGAGGRALGRPAGGRLRIGLAVGVALLPLLVLAALRLELAAEWRLFQGINITDRWPADGWRGYAGRFGGVLHQTWAFLGWQPAGLLLLGVLGLRLAWPRPGTGAHGRLAHGDAEAWWMPALWLLGSWLQLAVLAYWPARYMVGLLAPIAWLVAQVLIGGLRRLDVPAVLRDGAAAALGLLLLIAAWGPQRQAWLHRPVLAPGQRHSFAALAAQMQALPAFRTPGRGRVVIAGTGTADLLALYLPRAYPVDLWTPGDVCDFLAQEDARLLVISVPRDRTSREFRVLACPAFRAAQPLAAATLLGDYRRQGPTLVLGLPGP